MIFESSNTLFMTCVKLANVGHPCAWPLRREHQRCSPAARHESACERSSSVHASRAGLLRKHTLFMFSQTDSEYSHSSILKAGFALMTDRKDEGNVRTGLVRVQRYVAALTVRDHELA